MPTADALLNDALANELVLVPLIIGGLVGTLAMLALPLWIAMLVSGANGRATLAAFALWVGGAAVLMLAAWGGDLYHAFNATLAMALLPSLVAVPLIAFILSRVGPLKNPVVTSRTTETYVFGTSTASAPTTAADEPGTSRLTGATPRSLREAGHG